MIFKNGTIYDGTGERPYKADLRIENGRITDIAPRLPGGGPTLDCSGLAVAPGFIDLHSHNDWFMGSVENPRFLTPYLEQGITTHVGGNCGYGSAGFLEDTPHRRLLETNLFQAGLSEGIRWSSFDEYFAYLEERGMRGNLAVLAGSGTTRTSLRGYAPEPLQGQYRQEYLRLLEESLNQGALGVSFGTGYAPDIFADPRQLTETAELVKRHNKLITVHVRAFSSVSGAYPLRPLGEAHNLKALKEFLDLAEATGVKMHISHLIFVGTRTWKTVKKALTLIERYRQRGVDVTFDTYAHHCGATVITGILPEWFMAGVPGAYTDPKMLAKVRRLMGISLKLLGFGYEDMQLACANHPELDGFNGRFLSEISAVRGITNFDNYIDIAAKSDGTARMLLHRYSNPGIIAELMKHPACHFMTDSWVEPAGLQNPAVTGCFPLFLERAWKEGIIPLEEAVRKMTGANADRTGLFDRGYLRPGLAADVTIFNPGKIGDRPGEKPRGIEYVFLNGEMAVRNGTADDSVLAGRVVRGN